MTYSILVAVQVVIALVLIGLILVQHGKGADAGAAFGSGASGTVFGAKGSANFMSHATAGLATVFFLLSLVLAYMVGGNTAPTGSSVTQQLQKGVSEAAQVLEGKDMQPTTPSASEATDTGNSSNTSSNTQSANTDQQKDKGKNEGVTAKVPE